jgi:hypothetical protein
MMVRFLGHGGPQVCGIHFLPQKIERWKKKKTRRRDTSVVAFESY